MSKSATEILAAVNTKFDFQMFCQQQAKDCHQVLSSLLNQKGIRKDLAKEFDPIRNGYPARSSYPHWAHEIAYHLEDPKSENGAACKEAISNLCQMMIDEFGSDDRYFTHRIAENKEFPFLAKAARGLLGD